MQESDWKDRAITRRMDNKKLKKRIKELTKSRDEWKNKATLRKMQVNELSKNISEIKKNITRIMTI